MLIRLLFIFISMVLLNGCIGFRYSTSTGYDPLDLSGEFPYVFSKFEQAGKYSSSYDQRLSGTKLKKEHFLVKKVGSVLNNIEVAYLSLSKSNIFNYYKDKFGSCNLNRFDSTLCPEIDINVYALSEPIAVSFPNGRIHLSRSFIDGNLLFSAKNIGQLTGLLAHEYIHIKHGHLRYQWTIADAINDFKKEQRKVNWSKYLHYLPIFSYSHTIYSTRDLSDVYLIDFHLECMADFYTALLLDSMGYSVKEYIELLKGLYLYVDSLEPPNRRKLNELIYRIYFLEQLVNMNNIILPNYLVIMIRGQMQDYKYVAFSLEEYPILKKYAVYWGFALGNLGKNVIEHDFVTYTQNIAFPRNKVKDPTLPINTKNGNIMPLGIVRALVLPDKFVEMPIFSFLY